MATLEQSMDSIQSITPEIKQFVKNMNTVSITVKGLNQPIASLSSAIKAVTRVLNTSQTRIRDCNDSISKINKSSNSFSQSLGKSGTDLNKAIRTGGDKFNSTINKLSNQFNSTIQKTGKEISNASKKYSASLMENNIIKKQSPLVEDKVEKSGRSGGFLSSIGNIGSKIFNLDNAQQLAKLTIGGAMDEQKLKDMLSARTGGTGVFNTIKSDALNTGQDVNQALQNSLSFLPMTSDAGQLGKLNNFSQRLNVMGAGGDNPEGATEALTSAMQGDTSSLAQNFNIPEELINKSGIGNMGKIDSSNMDEFLSRFDQLMTSANMGETQFDQMLNDPSVKWQSILNNLKTQFADAGMGALQAIGPVLDNLFSALQSGRFQPFFDALGVAISVIAELLTGIITGIGYLGSAIQQNWGIIEPVLIAIGSALALWAFTQIPALIVKLWGMVEPILIQAAAWLLDSWPILLIGAAIGFLLYAMVEWGDTTVQVVGFIGGLFGVFFAFLFNKFAVFANVVLSIVEFFLNVWQDPIYAVKKLFFDLAINALQFMENMAKGIEKLINNIPGLHVDITSGMDNLLNTLESGRDNLKSKDDVVKLMRFNQIDYGDAFSTGQNVGEKVGTAVVDKVQGAFNSLGGLLNMGSSNGAADSTRGSNTGNSANAANTGLIPNVGTVGEVGKVNDTVDVSSEDLKTMRELAEMKNIQNFVSLTPTISVQTGDIRNGETADTLIDKLKVMLMTEIASSASAAYS